MGNVLSSEYTYDTAVLDLGANGRLRGTLVDGRVRRFTGVPFAQPPVGGYRWRKTRPLPADHVYCNPTSGDREEPLDCSRFGATAWQNPMLLPIRNKEEPRYDEDCLTLNMWMPVGEPPKGGWPVMIWFHGGLLQMGNPCIDDISDPTELVSTAGLNCIFLAPAYRLSIFGFLASQELAEEAERDGDDGVCGNYGMWDQWTALMWLQTYGERLGGDLKNVTLAGMSAGAYSAHAQTAHALLMAKDSVGSNPRLIRRIALHSNAIPTNPKSLLDVQPQFAELLAVHGISPTLTAAEKLDALRKIDAGTLMEKVKQMKAHTFRTVADGKFFPRDLMQRFGRGEFAKEFEKRGMSILVGEVLHEASFGDVSSLPAVGAHD
ncbi:hypothetical protein QFC19_006746 [Naganishia cerealis]|uniref:Uncharacterized protein n=1 Tax=Naganishia cerealis TaxID=610337 RepID=A0ACC2VDU0_9TREE|nr:hypothetical protein QFC19_006746 [Naganishia cerealis]